MGKPSWGCTLLTQFSLCVVVFLAFNIGGFQRSTYSTTDVNTRGSPLDLYFLSVRGGSRSLKQQNHLLRQMEKVASLYKVKFVVDISELGKDDPLLQNGTFRFPSLKVPWYTTNTLGGEENQYFLKQIPLAHGKTLDIIVVDSESLKDNFHMAEASNSGSHQMYWLKKTMEKTNSNWRIVVGFSPVIVCKGHGNKEEVRVYEPLHDVFLKYGVNAYLSKQGCTNNHYTREGSIAYIGNAGPADNTVNNLVDGNSIFREMETGFILHRVSALEIVSYFINAASKVVAKSTLVQRAKNGYLSPFGSFNFIFYIQSEDVFSYDKLGKDLGETNAIYNCNCRIRVMQSRTSFDC